jgi:cell division control protein 45
MFESKGDKYGLDNITQGSFSANFGYRNKFCACDVVLAVLAQMEPLCKDPSEATSAYLGALDCLSRSRISLLEEGILRAKEELSVVMQQVQNCFDLHSVVSAGPFLYTVIHDGAPNAKYFGRPTWLTLLAQHALRAHASMSGKKVQALPLIVSAPLDAEEGTCLVIGVPPVNDRSRKNLLGKAFEQALKRTNCRFRLDYFDSSVIQLRTEDRAKFFDGLVSLLS